MKRKIIILVLVALFISGCELKTSKTNSGVMSEEKVEITGQLSTKMGDEWVFVGEDGQMTNVTSQKINLDEYQGKNITIEGMFSGSTLYVDTIN